jgi:hypothetical protein
MLLLLAVEAVGRHHRDSETAKVAARFRVNPSIPAEFRAGKIRFSAPKRGRCVAPCLCGRSEIENVHWPVSGGLRAKASLLADAILASRLQFLFPGDPATYRILITP